MQQEFSRQSRLSTRRWLAWAGALVVVGGLVVAIMVARGALGGDERRTWRAAVEHEIGQATSDAAWADSMRLWRSVCGDVRKYGGWTTLLVDLYDGGMGPAYAETNVRYACPEHLAEVRRAKQRILAACSGTGDPALARRMGC